jgi:hypothetical protein
MSLDAQQIMQKLEADYPLLSKFFKPEIRKLQDMVYRERKMLGIETEKKVPKPPKEPKVI